MCSDNFMTIIQFQEETTRLQRGTVCGTSWLQWSIHFGQIRRFLLSLCRLTEIRVLILNFTSFLRPIYCLPSNCCVTETLFIPVSKTERLSHRSVCVASVVTDNERSLFPNDWSYPQHTATHTHTHQQPNEPPLHSRDSENIFIF